MLFSEEVKLAQRALVRVSVMHMAASVFALNRLCQMTGGIYAVLIDGSHGRQLLHVHVCLAI